MSEVLDKKNSGTRKGKPTYLYSIIGVAIVLFLLGLLGLIVINAEKLTRIMKERLEIQVMLKDEVNKENALALKDKLSQMPEVKFVNFIDKDTAAKDFEKALNEDFVSVLGYNPLGHTLNIKLKAKYINEDSLKKFSNLISSDPEIDQVSFQKELLSSLSSNIKKITIGIGVLALILIFSVIILIDNTVRLAMFSNRFLVKTMQMVGATRWFIAKPFDMKGIINGFISGILAVLALIGINRLVVNFLPEISQINSNNITILLYIFIVILGVIITLFSTHRSVVKYLKTSLDDLY